MKSISYLSILTLLSLLYFSSPVSSQSRSRILSGSRKSNQSSQSQSLHSNSSGNMDTKHEAAYMKTSDRGQLSNPSVSYKIEIKSPKAGSIKPILKNQDHINLNLSKKKNKSVKQEPYSYGKWRNHR